METIADTHLYINPLHFFILGQLTDTSVITSYSIHYTKLYEAAEATIVTAPGTSCRHQIKDGTGKKAMHPVEIMYEALI